MKAVLFSIPLLAVLLGLTGAQQAPFVLTQQQPLQPLKCDGDHHDAQLQVLDRHIHEFIHKTLKDWNSPGGVAVGLVRKDNAGNWVVEKEGYGNADINGNPVTPDTLFSIASNSKLFTALSVGLLITNESLSPRITWTSKFVDLIPGWETVDPITYAYTNIIDAMSHRTGLPRDDLVYERGDTEARLVERIHHLRPSAEFRETWQYNNNMYSLLSWLPELLLPDHPTLAQYVQEHFFDPLGMKATTYSSKRAIETGRLAEGMAREVKDDDDVFSAGRTRALPFWFREEDAILKTWAGAGGVISSVTDLVTWVQTLLLEGRHPKTNETIIPSDIIRAVAKGYTVNRGASVYPELSPLVYGGGQMRGAYRGHEFVEHDGSFPGYMTKITRLPHDDVGLVVLSNDDKHGTSIVNVIKYRILDHVFKLDPVDWNKRFKKDAASNVRPKQPKGPKPTSPPIPASRFSGLYRNEGYGDFELCLSTPHDGETLACKSLISEVPTILPKTVKDNNTVSLVTVFDKSWSTHAVFEYANATIFDVYLYTSLPTGNATEPYWVYPGEQDSLRTLAEFVIDGDGDSVVGFGLTGFWGAGVDVKSPEGGEAKERAEVWFDKIV